MTGQTATSHYVISAIGPDNPGIVMATTEVLLRYHCNIEASMMSILGGHFAMMLVVRTEASETDLARGLENTLSNVSVNEVPRYGERGARDDTHDVEVRTAEDHRGVMHTVSATLAEFGVNIVGLNSDVNQAGTETNCAMCFAVSLPEGVTEDQLQERIESALDADDIPKPARLVRVVAQHDVP